MKVVSGSNAARMAVGQFGYALGDAGMIAVDFRMFLLSIGNNFPFIVQGLAQVSKEAKEAGQSMGGFLKNNIDASMKMVLGANALMLALQVLPAIFNAINQESKEAAEEGIKALNREIDRLTSSQVKEKLNNLKAGLEGLRIAQKQQHPGIQMLSWIGMDITGLGAHEQAYENFVGKVKDKTKEIEESQKSRKESLEIEIADYDKLINQVEKGAGADKEILRLRNEQAKVQKELDNILMTSDEREKKRKDEAEKQKQAEEKKKQQRDEYISGVIEQYELTRKLNELEKTSNYDNIVSTQKLVKELLTQNLTLEQQVKLREWLRDIQAKSKLAEPDLKGSEDWHKKQLDAQKRFAELEKELSANAIVDQFDRERQIERNEADKKLQEIQENFDKGLISKEQYESAKFLIEQEYARKSRELDQQSFQYKIGMVAQIVDTITNAYNQFYSSMEANVSRELNKWESKEQKKIDEERKAALSHARTQAQKDRINEQYDRKEQQLEDEKQKRAEEKLGAWFQFQKAMNIVQATSNTALAATEALASAPPPWNYALMAAVIAAGMGQIAVIASQEMPQGFAEGGRLSKGKAGFVEGWHNEIIAPEQTFETIMRNELIPRVINNIGSDPALLDEMRKFNENIKNIKVAIGDNECKRIASKGIGVMKGGKL